MGRASVRIRARVRDQLRPGEVVQAAFAAQEALVVRARNRYRVVVVTNERLLVLDSGVFVQTRVGRLLVELDREARLRTRMGRPSGLFHRLAFADELPCGPLWVNRRYYAELRAADAALDAYRK